MTKTTSLINPNLLAFIAVAEYKTVHKAAKAIHLSQTAMTQRIQSLERKLNTTLFIRTTTGMKLTSEGEKLLRYSKTILEYSSETLSNLLDAGFSSMQRVKISGPTSIMISRIIPSCAKLMKTFPQLYLDFNINDTNCPVTSLKDGSSQFAVLKREDVSRDMQSKNLAPEEYQLVATKKWQKRKLKDILQNERIIDFYDSDKMTINYLTHFNLLDWSQPDRLFVNRTESLSTMFVEGYGYGVLTKEFSAALIKKGDLILLNSGKVFNNVLKLAWYHRPESLTYFSAIISSIT